MKFYKYNVCAIKDTYLTADTLWDTTPCAESPFHCSIFYCMQILIYSMKVNEIFWNISMACFKI